MRPLLALVLSALLAAAARAEVTSPSTLLAYSSMRQLVKVEGFVWGLSAGPQGAIVYRGQTLRHSQVERLADFFSKLPAGQDREYFELRALASELGCEGDAKGASDMGLATMGTDDQWHFTPLGRT